MLKIYALVVVIAVLGGIGYGAKYYYDTTQATISTLKENNAKLEVAVQTATESVKTLQQDMARLGELNSELQASLQKAEAYGDELRQKLNKMNLVIEALRDSKQLEGKMNGASAKLWRGIMEESGNTNKLDNPSWLQRPENGAGNQDGNEDRKDNGTNSSETKTTTTQ